MCFAPGLVIVLCYSALAVSTFATRGAPKGSLRRGRKTSLGAHVLGWTDLGFGCCDDVSAEKEPVFSGWLGDLDQCVQKCNSLGQRCGYVLHGWEHSRSAWCTVLRPATNCSKLRTGPLDCGSSGANGVRSYRAPWLADKDSRSPSPAPQRQSQARSVENGWHASVYASGMPRPRSPTGAGVAVSSAPQTMAVVPFSRQEGKPHIQGQPIAVAPVVAVPIAATDCALLGGILSVAVCAKCCFSAQIVLQRGLRLYGMARPCLGSWECEADGMTPTPQFESSAVQEMCSDSACVASIINGMKSNWMTAKSAGKMQSLCVSNTSVSDEVKLVAQRAYAAVKGRSNTSVLGGVNGTVNTSSWAAYALRANGATCFPGEAVAITDMGDRPLAGLRVGDHVLVEAPGTPKVLKYEPILGFLHVRRASHGEPLGFLRVRHQRGEFRASGNHLVFVVSTDGARRDKAVADLRAGDRLMHVGSKRRSTIELSEVLAVEPASSEVGMLAPLTAAGTLVVDGVLASCYASPSPRMVSFESRGSVQALTPPHWLMHLAMAPVRIYHASGLAKMVAPMWAAACTTSDRKQARHWLCQGSGLDTVRESTQSDSCHADEEDNEDIHPLARILENNIDVGKLMMRIQMS